MNREREGILHCLRGALQGEPFPAGHSPDWESIWTAGRKHGVIPLLYPFVRQLPHAAAPSPDLLAKWRSAYMLAAASNMKMYNQLGEILRHMRQADIPVIVLKGAHLAEYLYENIAMRPMVDIDLWFHQDDFQRAGEVFRAIGYSARLNALHHLNYDRNQGERSVEMHWHLVDGSLLPKVDLSESWRRRRVALLAGAETSVLAPEDLLLHLCIHIIHHQFEATLRDLCDIDRVIAVYRSRLDWDYCLAQIKAWQLGKGVYLILSAAKELLHTPLPPETRELLMPDGQKENWAEFFIEYILRDKEDNRQVSSLPPSPLPSPSIMRLGRRKGIADKISLVSNSIFLSPAALRNHYTLPHGMLGACLGYALRTRDLFRRHAVGVQREILKTKNKKMPIGRTARLCDEMFQWAAGSKVL